MDSGLWWGGGEGMLAGLQEGFYLLWGDLAPCPVFQTLSKLKKKKRKAFFKAFEMSSIKYGSFLTTSY